MAKQNMAQAGRETMAMSVDETIVAAQLSPRTIERLQTEADALYARLTAQLEQWQAMMGSTKQRTPQEASIDAMRAHFLYCAALGVLNQTNVDATVYLGKTAGEIAETVVAKASARRRGRGARTVQNRYGAKAVRRITGHTIRQ